MKVDTKLEEHDGLKDDCIQITLHCNTEAKQGKTATEQRPDILIIILTARAHRETQDLLLQTAARGELS